MKHLAKDYEDPDLRDVRMLLVGIWNGLHEALRQPDVADLAGRLYRQLHGIVDTERD